MKRERSTPARVSTKTGEPQVAYDEAVRRVRQHAGASRLLASSIASIVWPKHRMKAQGSARAVGPFIRRMLRDGVLSLDSDCNYRVARSAGGER